MFRPYRDVLSIPGALAFTVSGALSRLPISMLGIGIVLLVEASTGSYAAAGAVAGAFGVSQSVLSPLVGRAVDRYGQARVMFPAIAVHVCGLVLLVLICEAGAPIWTLVAIAIVAGASIGSLGALVRTRWSFVLADHERGPALLHTAYSLESVLDEVIFIAGPILVTVLATRLFPALGVLAAALAVAVGGSALLLQRGSEPPPSPPLREPAPGVLAAAGMVVVLLAMACAGVLLGAVEVLTVAFAEERGELGNAGVALASFALGSLLAGLVWGTLSRGLRADRSFLIGILALAVAILPVLLVQNLLHLALVLFVAGFSISPMLISGNAVVQDLVHPSRLTEGLTWIYSAIGVGAAAGAAVAGASVDAVGARGAFVVPVASGAAAALVVLLGARWVLNPRPVSATSGAPQSPGRPGSPG